MQLGEPQSFNRYSYVENQPTNYVDPSGLNMSPTTEFVWCEPNRWDPSTMTLYAGRCYRYIMVGGGSSGGVPGSVGSALNGPILDEDCGELGPPPDAPPNVNVAQNIREAKKHRVIFGFFTRPIKDTENADWFRTKVQKGGDWDFKKIDLKYENYGNWHYGVTGMAAGFSENTLLRMAGWAQAKDGDAEGDGGSSGTLAEIMASAHSGIEGGEAPYGDQWKDQYWILRGINYYTHGCYK